jgi:hypothetical protein
MPKRPRQPREMGPTRQTYADVVQRVIDYLGAEENDGMRKRLEAACGMDHSAFSHRLSNYRGEHFRIEHFSAMSVEARAPEPWPFVDWGDAEAFQAFRLLVSKR